MAQKPTAQIKKAVPAIKKVGLLSNLTGEKDNELIQMNTRQVGLLQRALGEKGVRNPASGLLSFPPGGGQASHDHGAAAGAGGNSGGSGGGPSGHANGADPGGANDGGGISGPGGGPHSPGGAGGLGTMGGGDPNKGGSPSNDPGFSGGRATGVGDPTSPTNLALGFLHNMFSTTPENTALSAATIGLPAPIGPVAKAALAFGQAAGTLDKQAIAGVKDGSIDGSIGVDANGQEVAHIGGAQYGGTAGLHGGNSGEGGPSGHNIDPSQVNQFNQQNAINASTGVPGSIPGNIPSLGLLGQFQQPTQQWTVPGYGFQTPGYGYLQWGQK